jgi:hypothetical protein
MTDRAQNEMTCGQFEALLAEALDSTRAAADETTEELAGAPAAFRAAFQAHRESCAKCAPLYAETLEGMLLLKSLEEVQPPRNLLHNILAATSRVESKTSPASDIDAGWLVRVRSRFMLSFAGVLRSRFAASFCMAFFSLSLTLSLAGVKISDLAHMAAHPSELRKSLVLEYTQVEARVMRYYDNMRLVYEVESRVRELKKAATPTQSNEDKGTQPDQQNWNQPVPGVPGMEEVGDPQTEESYRRNMNDRDLRQLTGECISCSGQAEFRKVAGMIGESLRKSEGAQI